MALLHVTPAAHRVLCVRSCAAQLSREASRGVYTAAAAAAMFNK
jgi:hypothetical protein